MDDIAIVRADGLVENIVRGDGPPVAAPAGCTLVPVSQLPVGWRKAPPPLPPVPEEIEAWRLREWLIHHGHSIASIDAAIAAIPDQVERELTDNQWNYNTSYTRRHPMFAAFVRVTGLTEDQIDAAFREAASYE